MQQNYFDISTEPYTDSYEYEILGLPPGRDRAKLSPLVDATDNAVPFLRQNKGKFATDHISTIVSWKRIHPDDKVSDNNDEWGPYDVPDVRSHDGTERTRLVNIRLIRKLNIDSLHDYT